MAKLSLLSVCAQVPESQAKPAPAVLASSAGTASAGHGSPRSQGAVEPMDTESHADQRMVSAAQQARGEKSMEADGKMQVAGRTRRTRADGEPQVATAPRGGGRTASAAGPQDDAVAQGGAGTQGQRTREDRKMQADRRIPEDKGTWPEGSTAPATEGQSEKGPVTSLSPQSRPPERPSSERPWSPQIIECFEQSPEGSSVPEEPGFVLGSDEAAVTAPRSYKTAVLGAPAGGSELPARRPPRGGLEQPEGARRQGPEWSGMGRGKPEDGLVPCPKEEQLGTAPSLDVGGCPPAGGSPEGPTPPSLPGLGLTQSPQEALPSTPTSPHISTTTFAPSGDQTWLGSALPLHLGPGTPAQSPPQATAAASSEGAGVQGPDVEGRPPGPRSCDPGLIDSLKNYLLLLLKLSSTETGGGDAESREGAASRGPTPSPTLAPNVEVAGLSPRTSRRILERVENNHLVQSAQTLLLSPCTSRRLTGLLDREVQAGRQALAAARGPGPSPLAVPAIVVGEEEGPGLASEGSSEGEGEVSLEGPGLLGESQESSMEGLPGGSGGPTASGQGPLSAERGAQEALREEEAPGEALTGLPAATPEELALGARRKRFLPKVRAVGDGEAAKPEERESPTVSPRGPRKGLAPGSPGTPGREKRSPTQGRKAGLLEVPRAEEEPAAGASGLDTEPAPDEGKQDTPAKARKAKELLKGEQGAGGAASRESSAGRVPGRGRAPAGLQGAVFR